VFLRNRSISVEELVSARYPPQFTLSLVRLKIRTVAADDEALRSRKQSFIGETQF